LYQDLKTNHPDEYQFEEKTALWIGRRLANSGKEDDAVKFLNFCIGENPASEAASIGYYTLGNLSWNKGNKESAKENYKKYLEKFPGDKMILKRMEESKK